MLIQKISNKRAKVISTLALCLAALILTSAFKTAGYVITGNITAKDGTIFCISYDYAGKKVCDSAVSHSDNVVFRGSFPEPVICTLSNSTNQQIKIFIAENADMLLTGEIGKIYNLQIKNAIEDDTYNEFKKKSMSLSGDYRIAVKQTNADLHDKTSAPYLAFHKRLDSLTTGFVQAHNNTTAAALAIMDSYLNNPDRKKAQACYGLLSELKKSSFYGKRIAQFIDAETNIAPGKPAPNFKLKNTKGEWVSLTDLKGKYLLIDFWASWCAPCRKENPDLIRLYKELNDSRIRFVSLSMDASASSWAQAVATDKLPWLQLNDPKSLNGDVADIYGVKASPFNCVINPQGIIVAVNVHGDKLVDILKNINRASGATKPGPTDIHVL